MKTHYSLHSIENFTSNMLSRMVIKSTWHCRLEAYAERAPKQYTTTSRSITSFQIWELSVPSLKIFVEIDQRLTCPTTVHVSFEVRLMFLLRRCNMMQSLCKEQTGHHAKDSNGRGIKEMHAWYVI